MVQCSIRVAAGLLTLAASACGTETGVLIEVTRDDTVSGDINRLEFYVGIDGIEGHPSSFVDFDAEDGARVAGRDLHADLRGARRGSARRSARLARHGRGRGRRLRR